MEKLSYRIFIFTLLFSILAFGAVEPWSLLILEGGVLLALTLYLFSKAREREVLRKVPGLLPLLLLLAYMALQVIPLPAGLVRLLSPGTYKLHMGTVGLVQPVHWMSLSIHPHQTLLELARYAAYAGAYVLAVQLFSNKKYLRPAVTTLMIFVGVVATLSIIQHYAVPGKVWWFRDPVRSQHFGPYFHRNHYAGFVGMVLPVMAAMFMHLRPSLRYTSFRERVVEFFAHPGSHAHILLGTASIVAAASIFISLSRGGIVATCLALGGLGILLAVFKSHAREGICFALLCAVILVSVGWFGWGPIFDRFNKIRDDSGEITELRPRVWEDSLGILRDFPLTGTGFGTFKDIYPAYRTIPEGAVFSRAHNDYIELATDGGLVASVLVLWFLASVFIISFRRSLKRRDAYSRYLFWGALCGVFYMGIHSLVDFNLHIGANGLLFITLVAVMVSAPHTRIHGRRKETYLPAARHAAGFGKFLAACAVLTLTVVIAAGNLAASRSLKPLLSRIYGSDALSPTQTEADLEALEKTARFAPFDELIPLAAGLIHDRSEKTMAVAADDFRKALALAPADSYALLQLATCYARLGKDAVTDRLFSAAVSHAPMDSEARGTYALWLLSRGRLDEGILNIRKAIEIAPGKTDYYLGVLKTAGIEAPDIFRALPDRVTPYLRYARQLADSGRTEEAGAAFEKALSFVGNEKTIQPWYFTSVSNFYQKTGRNQDALRVLQTAISYLPESPALRMQAARLYERVDIPYRAVEEYERVLLLDPGNVSAKKRLAALKGDEGR